MATKKKNITTAEALRAKSESAIGAFRVLVSNLRTTNEEAAIVKSANQEQIVRLEQENAAIDILTSQNEKIVDNIENLLGM